MILTQIRLSYYKIEFARSLENVKTALKIAFALNLSSATDITGAPFTSIKTNALDAQLRVCYASEATGLAWNI